MLRGDRPASPRPVARAGRPARRGGSLGAPRFPGYASPRFAVARFRQKIQATAPANGSAHTTITNRIRRAVPST